MTNLLHALAAAVEPFHRLDPAGWFAWSSMLSRTTALVALAIGLFCAGIGGRSGIFRFVAVPLGMLLGIALTAPVVGLLAGSSIPTQVVELALPAALGILAGIVPHTIAFVMLGSIGAMVGAALVSDHELLVGAVPGFLLAGVLGIVFARVVDTLSASALGGLLVGGALLRLASDVSGLRLLNSSPWAPVVVAAVVFAAGAALQLVSHPDDEELAAKRAAAAQKKAAKREDREREARFAKYGR